MGCMGAGFTDQCLIKGLYNKNHILIYLHQYLKHEYNLMKNQVYIQIIL